MLSQKVGSFPENGFENLVLEGSVDSWQPGLILLGHVYEQDLGTTNRPKHW